MRGLHFGVHGLDVFEFGDAARVVYYRGHKPEKFDDDKKRAILDNENILRWNNERKHYFVAKILTASESGKDIAATANVIVGLTDEGKQLMNSSINQMATIHTIVSSIEHIADNADNQPWQTF